MLVTRACCMRLGSSADFTQRVDHALRTRHPGYWWPLVCGWVRGGFYLLSSSSPFFFSLLIWTGIIHPCSILFCLLFILYSFPLHFIIPFFFYSSFLAFILPFILFFPLKLVYGLINKVRPFICERKIFSLSFLLLFYSSFLLPFLHFTVFMWMYQKK